MSMDRYLYIVSTNQKARDFKKVLINENPFVVVKSLESIIDYIFKSNCDKFLIDINLIPHLIYKIIKSKNIEYFSYLNIDSDSLSYIGDFIIKCNRNKVAFKDFLSGDKLKALIDINNEYQLIKKENNLYDLADLEKFVYSFISENENYLNDFDDVFILDQFTIGKTDFINSEYQELILDKFRNIFKPYSFIKNEDDIYKKSVLIKPKKEVFDNIDEIKTALKIARKLLLSGVNEDEIIIVTTDIEEYAPLYRLFLDEYGLKGYDSIGTPLITYKGKYFTSSDSVKKSYQDFQLQFNIIKERSYKLNIPIDEEKIKQNLLKSIYVLDEKIGIELTEPNQLIGLLKTYQHIIFIGADIEHFPPKSEDNFLYSIEQSIKYFHTNNYYYSSEIQFEELKRLSENLYIINSSYKDKKKLSPSILIPDNFDLEIDVDDINSKNDITKIKKIVKPKGNLEDYIKSINYKFFTDFDGVGVENIEVDHLSASQLNKFSICPLTYLYNYNLGIKAPRKVNSGFDSMEEGTLMHEAFEDFGKKVNEGKNPNYELMKDVLSSIYDKKSENLSKKNIFHDLVFEEFKKGLNNDDNKGVLARFVDYVVQNNHEFEGLRNSEFEKEFYLNKNLEITDSEDDFFIKGFIDRIDNLSNYVNVIDYKSKTNITNESKKIKDFKEFQLSLYTLYAKQLYKKDVVSSFLTFKIKDKDYTEYSKTTTDRNKAFKLVNVGKKNEKENEIAVYFDDEFEENLKKRIFEIKDNIENGKFYFDNSDEDVCKYCDIRYICHQSLLTKEL